MKFRTARFSLMTVAAAVALSTSPAWAQIKVGFNVPLTGFAAADGKSALDGAKLAIAQAAPAYTAVLNGRFKGGHITRHYGQPSSNVHAVQLEMTQCSYMQEAMPFDYLPERAERTQPTLRAMLDAALTYAERT